MITVRAVTSTAVPTSLLTLLGIADTRRNVAAVQFRLLTGTVSWGHKGDQPLAIATTDREIYPTNSLKEIFFAGVGTVAVLVLYHS